MQDPESILGFDDALLNEVVENIDDWLSSEIEDTTYIQLSIPETVALPTRLHWIVKDNSNVTDGQTLAILASVSKNSDYASASGSCLVSPSAGRLKHLATQNAIIDHGDKVIGEITHVECRHDVVVHGLCVSCLQPLYVEATKRPLDTSDYFATTHSKQHFNEKLTAGFITNESGLEVAANVYEEIECGEICTLINKKRLCLVLDLDNTLVHASGNKPPIDIDINIIDVVGNDEILNRGAQYVTSDAEVLETRRNLENSVIATVVKSDVDGKTSPSFFKLRPGVFTFLQRVSTICDLYLFTMGTRGHAISALAILDPKGTFFGNRVFSRWDATANLKSLDRIFPRTKNLVLVLDDSEHAWTCNSQVIKVHPYFFFVDPFFHLNKDPRGFTRITASLQCPCVYSNFHWNATLKCMERRSQPDTTEDGFALPKPLVKNSVHYNNYFVAEERPKSLFKENKQGGMNMIQVHDYDNQLEWSLAIIKHIHENFYKHIQDQFGDELDTEELQNAIEKGKLPCTAKVLESIRCRVLDGVCLYANPVDFKCLKTDETYEFLKQSDFGLWATKLGATIASEFSNDVTHYLCNNRIPKNVSCKRAKWVHIKWLEACIYTWKRQDESLYCPENWTEPICTFWQILKNDALDEGNSVDKKKQ